MTTEEKRRLGLELVGTLFKDVDSGGPGMHESLGEASLCHLFGDQWQRDDMTLQQRSLITCTILIALNREAEQRLHFQGARNVGVDRNMLEAVITHAAYYSGWPTAASAARILNEVWPEDSSATPE